MIFVLSSLFVLSSCDIIDRYLGNDDLNPGGDQGSVECLDKDDNGKCDDCDNYFADGEDLDYTNENDHEQFDFTLNDDGTYTVSLNRMKHLANVKIPYVYRGRLVTVIGDELFYLCRNLKSIEIPETITHIGARAFSDCTFLEKVEIPGSVTSIGKQAFISCNRLETVVIPRSVTYLGDCVFENSAVVTVKYEGTESEWSAIEKKYIGSSYGSPEIIYEFDGE